MLPIDTRTEIGQRIKQFRTEKGLGQAELARDMEISVNFLSEIENGKKGFSAETLHKLCSIYGLSADYILFGEKVETAAKADELIEISNRLDDDSLSTVIEYLQSLQNMRNIK
jgi:transcriptional regulator with XRE-family HTH domain